MAVLQAGPYVATVAIWPARPYVHCGERKQWRTICQERSRPLITSPAPLRCQWSNTGGFICPPSPSVHQLARHPACGPMVERRRLGLDPSKLLGKQIVIGANRFAKDGKSRDYVTSKFGRSCANARRAFTKRTEIMSSYIHYFVPISRFVAITHFLKDSVQIRAFLGQTQCLMGKKCPFTWYVIYILYIAYHTELILQLTQNEGSLIGKIKNPSPCVGIKLPC